MSSPQIVWLRRDLRLSDHPALCGAAGTGPVIPVYVLDDDTPRERKLGGASRWWLHHSLAAMAKRLGSHRSRLVLRRGRAADVLAKLVDETGAEAIHAIPHYEPWWREAERELGEKVTLHLYEGNYLAPPGSITTGAGEPYKIYTPFWRAMQAQMPPSDPLAEPSLTLPESWPDSDELDDWNLLPTKPDWAVGIADDWEVGELAAHAQLEDWVQRVDPYDEARNLPSTDGSSRLSPHLHFGEISAAQIWAALREKRSQGASVFRSELAWRDFAQNVIFQFPDYPERNYRGKFDKLQWRDHTKGQGKSDLEAWQQGRTGYPIVDAGMRQLWATGWMHNRVRMIAASFLIKHLLIDWRVGERWFWDTLVDADYGNNAVNWQWVSGTGVDSQMFPRIMAPLTQSSKFDAADYIRECVPELADLAEEHIHDPPAERRPGGYPEKIVGHREARERALAAYRTL